MTGFGSSCGACKFLRRKCVSDCVFAPYFSYDQAAEHFAAVHKVFGASNVSKLLLHLPEQNRSEAAMTISYEALARIQDPIYGCVAHIFALQQQVASLQKEIEILSSRMANSALNIGYNNPNNGLQFHMQQDATSIQDYIHQQALLLPETANANTGWIVNSQTDLQIPPEFGWENQTPIWDCDSDPPEGVTGGMEQEIFAHYSWLDNSSII
ncbi:LOB domain-containing protein 33-like [Malania oleifera]|uniref:LOB domain-containing protein 33-like n=1 Tax=Malania oleifera TaxID=397392 RepID=UPI0025AE872A|nr:LOB domain-containing protein 33-like [Malania oleifera]